MHDSWQRLSWTHRWLNVGVLSGLPTALMANSHCLLVCASSMRSWFLQLSWPWVCVSSYKMFLTASLKLCVGSTSWRCQHLFWLPAAVYCGTNVAMRLHTLSLSSTMGTILGHALHATQGFALNDTRAYTQTPLNEQLNQ